MRYVRFLWVLPMFLLFSCIMLSLPRVEVVATSCALLFVGAFSLAATARQRRWPTVVGELKRIERQGWWAANSGIFQARPLALSRYFQWVERFSVKYVYFVNQVEHVREESLPSIYFPTLSRKNKEDPIKVNVYHHPRSPEKALLTPGTYTGGILMSAAGLLGMLRYFIP